MGAIDAMLASVRAGRLNQTPPAPVNTLPAWSLAWRWYCRCVEFNRSRRQLLELSDHELADIGISRERAIREAGRWPKLLV